VNLNYPVALTNKMKRIIITMLIGIFMLTLVSSSNWQQDPENCPNNLDSQTCSGIDLVCGSNGGVTFCYNMSSLNAPASPLTTHATSWSSSYDGGYLIDCEAYDGGEPHCDNSGNLWCDRDSTCYNIGRITQCEANKWSGETGDTSCTTCRTDGANHFYCDGSYTDGDGCEVRVGDSCGAGTGTVDVSETCVSSVGNCTSATRLDCDNDDTDGDTTTCNGVNGCEILIGGDCSVGVLSGTYDSVCSGTSGSCIVDKSYFETGTFTQYSTALSHGGFLWGKNFGIQPLINFTGSTDSNFLVDNNGNMTIGNKITFAFGMVLEAISSTWLRITGNVEVVGELNVTQGITAENLTIRSNLICNETICFNLQDLNKTGDIDTDTWASNYTNYYNKSEIDNNFSLYYTKTEVDNNLSLYLLLTDQTYNETQIILDNNASWSSTYNTTYDSYVSSNHTNKSNYWDDMDTFNATQMEDSGGTLNILVSWLTSLFYTKAEVYNKTETYTKSEIDSNITGQGYIDSTNVAYVNKSNVFAENQNFSKNITMNGGDILLNDNASITRSGVATKTWVSESGNWITKFGD